MLFKQSLFQSVLDRLDSEEEPAEQEEAAHRIRGLNVSFAATVLGGETPDAHRPDEAYRDNLGDPVILPEPEPAPPEPALPVMPEHLARTSREEVATELAITSDLTRDALQEKRRSFAKANHPDGVAALFREQATIRMTLANQLIDEAIRRLRR
ncbi:MULTISPECIES: hypothetical protein [Rhizobium]|uniref:Uncharacterized protein n=1 Tax=Rhizobium tropici TaxID=398 RepID=A0A6P1C0V1_RHITR|nr:MULTISPECIES: hypothetical protein [Rhizobium]AGB72057.1 hypothetical protein RTCIAT899_CH13390 [Rhizobium tropici CIAT 899]MBB4243416.1 hypothetical protein [Rhizobium tropici]MBB5593071.1 hypothetical protein [Rhizobium tropici]MBB6493742.1 hypothetical protein [Rhizobium tropici]NEV09986.1 hypothetical protein [Rhizobium tropici]